MGGRCRSIVWKLLPILLSKLTKGAAARGSTVMARSDRVKTGALVTARDNEMRS